MGHSSEYLIRFHGIMRLFGEKALAKFEKSHICVIGIGGVGTWAVEAFARSGIGEITIIDLDDICLSNTNRQLHALLENVGKSKVHTMKERILSINPECKVNIIEDFLTKENFQNILKHNFDYIVDAIDGLHNKCLILDYCLKNNKKLICIGAAGGIISPTNIRVDDINKAINDKLLRRVRKKLRQDFGYQKSDKKPWGVTCVYTPDNRILPFELGDIKSVQLKQTNLKLDCESGLGTATFVTATFGNFAASHVLKELAFK